MGPEQIMTARTLLRLVFVLALSAGCSSDDPAPTATRNGPYFQRLTTTSAAEASPAFSPDGTRLAYERDNEIWVMDLATRTASRVAPHGNHVSWSADGAALLFVRRDLDGGGPLHRLIRLTLASGVVDTVSADTVDAYEPAAAPVGGAVALRTLSRVNTLQSLRVIEANGDDRATLTNAGRWVDTSPAWSPDGAWIAFVRLDDDGLARLMRVPSQGTAEATPVAGATDGASAPGWHPDGRIVFARNGVICAIPATGGSVLPLVQGAGFAQGPRISPDERHLVFVTDRAGNSELWQLVDPAGVRVGPYSY
jgi:Tol biopolymer transport system component